MKNYKIAIKKFHITGGIFNKKKIKFLSTENIKPTKSNIKKILYSYINKYKNIYLLELFAGTGIISFDTYSNNSKKNILVEKNIQTYQKILSNKKELIKNNNFQIYLQDSYIWIKNIIMLNISYIIFDAPYDMKNINLYLRKFNAIITLKKYICIFFENNKKLILKKTLLNYFIIYKNKKGNINIYMLKKIL